MRYLMLLLLACHAQRSLACYTPPAAQIVGVDAQLAGATSVALATVVDATPEPGAGMEVDYRFRVVQQLAGPVRTQFSIAGRRSAPHDGDTTFRGHTDPAFWMRGGGRTMNGADCAIHPAFKVGDTYLVFLGSTPTWRSFEKIDVVDGQGDAKDRWLGYVRAWLRASPASTGPASGANAPADDRVARFIYAFHRAGLSRAALTGIEIAGAPPDIATRARKLADAFDRILAADADVTDAQIEAALRDEAALGPDMRAWRASRGHA